MICIHKELFYMLAPLVCGFFFGYVWGRSSR
jgi:hypothetical protein